MNVKKTWFEFIIIKNVLRMFETTFHNYIFIGGRSNSLISCLKQKVTHMYTFGSIKYLITHYICTLSPDVMKYLRSIVVVDVV